MHIFNTLAIQTRDVLSLELQKMTQPIFTELPAGVRRGHRKTSLISWADPFDTVKKYILFKWDFGGSLGSPSALGNFEVSFIYIAFFISLSLQTYSDCTIKMQR